MTKRMVSWAAILTLFVATGLAQQHKLTADDYIEIQQLYAKYNVAIDSGDAEGYAATFTADGVFNNFKGHDALVGFIKQWRERMNGASRRHWNTNLVITPTSDGASGTVYLFLMDVSAKPPAIQTAARYEDQLVKTADGWRFKVRQTKSDAATASAAPASPKQ